MDGTCDNHLKGEEQGTEEKHHMISLICDSNKNVAFTSFAGKTINLTKINFLQKFNV
jgi:hypothetical protein